MMRFSYYSHYVRLFLIVLIIVFATLPVLSQIKKLKDVVVYSDTAFYTAFPSVVKLQSGELMVAFRRAPNRIIYGEKGNNHVDHNSYLVSVKSTDGEDWTKDPELIYAHPFGGSQDPCLLQLKDGTLLCTSYGWTTVGTDAIAGLKQPYFEAGGYIFLGGYVIQSTDDGKTWKGPYYPPHVKTELFFNAYGHELPAYNRGALYEAKDGRILWIVAVNDSPGKTSNYLLASKNKGVTWECVSEVAKDAKVSFNEASVYQTPKGDIIGFLRTGDFGDQAVIARSTNGGKSFYWESMGFKGHPLTAMRLPDNRVLLVYGYRHKPYGIRARILNAECNDWKTAKEFVLRDDGGTTDIGYPWPILISPDKVLVVYYFNKENANRYIAGTIIEIQP
ncbi:MAG: sialidase family protein [Agriterribacter sp.]